jgi:hypothetical protein
LAVGSPACGKKEIATQRWVSFLLTGDRNVDKLLKIVGITPHGAVFFFAFFVALVISTGNAVVSLPPLNTPGLLFNVT